MPPIIADGRQAPHHTKKMIPDRRPDQYGCGVSRRLIPLLVLAAVVGVVVSLAAWGFL